MNRLWVRLSLGFSTVFLMVLMASLVTALFTNPDFTNAQENIPPEVLAYLDKMDRERRFPNATIFLATFGLAAVTTGVLMSRSLTAPLAELEKAAQAIGLQNLSQRVEVRGTQEIQAVATRFNEMAGQLEEAESLRRNLLADVAHELRHPLHVLQGNLQAILDDVYPLSKEEIARLLEQTHHLTGLVNDLHELAQAEAHQLVLQKEITDMAALVKETAVAFKPIAASHDIALTVELLGPQPHLAVDAGRLRQVLGNLLGNALRYTPAGGKILVTAVQEGDAQADTFQIRVKDTGIGIAAENLPRVFDRFYRADSARNRSTNSLGLGLAIAKAIVEEHNGQLQATSPGVGKGSTFTVSLPAQS